jgi:hypothetical protein
MWKGVQSVKQQHPQIYDFTLKALFSDESAITQKNR